MAQWTIRLHLTIDAETVEQAHDMACELGEVLADQSNPSLIYCCVDNEDEIRLADLNERMTLRGRNE